MNRFIADVGDYILTKKKGFEGSVQADNSKVYLQGDEKPPKGVPVYKGPQDGRYYNTEEVPEKQTLQNMMVVSMVSSRIEMGNGGFQIAGIPIKWNYEATPADVLQWYRWAREENAGTSLPVRDNRRAIRVR